MKNIASPLILLRKFSAERKERILFRTNSYYEEGNILQREYIFNRTVGGGGWGVVSGIGILKKIKRNKIPNCVRDVSIC